MNVEQTIRDSLVAEGLADIPVAAVRFQTERGEHGQPVPAILYRATGVDHFGGLDGAATPVARRYAIECRAATLDGAQGLAGFILAGFDKGRLQAVSEYDDLDNASGERSGYFSRVLELEFSS